MGTDGTLTASAIADDVDFVHFSSMGICCCPWGFIESPPGDFLWKSCFDGTLAPLGLPDDGRAEGDSYTHLFYMEPDSRIIKCQLK